jgi:hypothetical protein
VRNQIFSGVSFGKNFDALRAAFVGVIRRWRLMLQRSLSAESNK